MLIMTEDQLPINDDGSNPPALGIEMLSAAHLLLSSERATDRDDLLISTCIEVLDSGPASTAHLLKAVKEIWPGAPITTEMLLAAIQEAQELDLIAAAATLEGELWTLGTIGKSEIDATRAWFEDAMDRLTRQIEDRARDDFGEVKHEVASNWARVILRLFSAEIARSASSYAGDVEQASAKSIRPMVLDGSAMLRALDQVALAEGTRDFLKGCLLACVDESDPFGNELIGQVATSCVLHAIAAGRGRAGAQEVMGSLENQRVLLDTPLLVSLLGSASASERLEALIRQAVAFGMEVVVPEHVLDELDDVIKRVEGDHLQPLTSALQGGMPPRAYAQIVKEQVLELFLDGVEAKEIKTWNDFRLRQKGMTSRLESLGVVVREHGNKNRSNVVWVDSVLTEEIAASPSGRGAKAIARDAESIEMVWRARRRGVKDKGALWPGGWIVSNDRHASPAYRRVNHEDSEPLVLTPAQWATLLTEAAPAAEIPELVAAAASLLRQESMLRIATKYPPAIALTLAKSLSGEYSSSTDVRVAQLASLGELLEHASAGETVTGERLASEIAARRTNRLAAAGREQLDLNALERARLDAAVTRSTTVITEETAKRVAAEKRSEELEKRMSLWPRRVALGVLMTAAVGALVIFAVIGLPWFVVGTALALALLGIIGRKWVTDPSTKLWHLALAAVPEVLGILDVVTRFLPSS